MQFLKLVIMLILFGCHAQQPTDTSASTQVVTATEDTAVADETEPADREGDICRNKAFCENEGRGRIANDNFRLVG